MWEFADPFLPIQLFRSRLCPLIHFSNVFEFVIPFVFTRILTSFYAICKLRVANGRGEQSSQNEAFFRSLLAFYGEGLYEVPYIEGIQFLNGSAARP